MRQAIQIHRSGKMADTPEAEHLDALYAIARQQNDAELVTALRQRYPHMVQAA